MSGAFYSRYVPPGKPSSSQSEGSSVNGQKRKHEESTNHDEPRPKKHQKSQTIPASLTASEESKHAAGETSRSSTQARKQMTSAPSNEDVLSKYSVTKHAQSKGTNENDITRKKTVTATNLKSREESSEDTKHRKSYTNGPRTQEAMAEDHNAEDAEDEEVEDEDDILQTKHPSVMSKFKRSKETASKTPKLLEEHPTVEELHGLEPLPQPEPAPATTSKPTYSTLPPWLANPIRLAHSDRRKFDDFRLNSKILQNLKSKYMTEAFSVQSAVLPLLIQGPGHHNGDICISAATGSGKTLAYILPMVQSLMDYATTHLRGLIVVPTRELVKQAREVCEMCAAGTGLKITSAVGSKSLKEEEGLLVEQYQEYERETEAVDRPMTLEDWSNLDMQEILSQSKQKTKPGFVRRYRSKVDILICTPGRLVEHLRSTEGFSLDHLEWLVVDEADRLMNESFQEWVEIVVPALDNRRPSDQNLTNEILQRMRMPKPVQHLQKIILSATFSLDISKLNSLKLRNPKLIVIGDGKVGNKEEASGLLSLPPTLSEFAIPVGDGSEKPLYLLELMNMKLRKRTNELEPISEDEDEASDSETSSDEISSSESSRTSSKSKCLIFAGSTESAERLYRLLTILDPSLADRVATLTKTSASSSQHVLSQLRRGKISFVIATDRASRGLDILELDHVVSYDVPTSITSYVHRVGRTARAGFSGQAWTLIAHREARWFWNEIGKGEQISRRGKVEKVTLGPPKEMKDMYESALKALGEEVVGKA